MDAYANRIWRQQDGPLAVLLAFEAEFEFVRGLKEADVERELTQGGTQFSGGQSEAGDDWSHDKVSTEALEMALEALTLFPSSSSYPRSLEGVVRIEQAELIIKLRKLLPPPEDVGVSTSWAALASELDSYEVIFDGIDNPEASWHRAPPMGATATKIEWNPKLTACHELKQMYQEFDYVVAKFTSRLCARWRASPVKKAEDLYKVAWIFPDDACSTAWRSTIQLGGLKRASYMPLLEGLDIVRRASVPVPS